MIGRHNRTGGRLLAVFLSGVWRESVPDPKVSAEELREIIPLLLGSGAGALGWWGIRNSSLKTDTAASELLQAYRFHALNTALYQHKIKQALSILHTADIEPILIKGWANARLYPEPGLRPYGDVDLCVRRDRYAVAVELLLNTTEGRKCQVDLHRSLGRLDDRAWEEFYTRSQLVNLDEIEVRVLSPEDHLHILSVHMLEDGAWRPIQLCDIAAVIESAPSNFDWDVCLGRNRRRAKWIASSIYLANQLLGANVECCPPKIRNTRLPTWLIPNVLRHWERPCLEQHRPPELIMKTLRHPTRVPKAALQRWPDPIGATIRLKGPFNAIPRLPFQLADFFVQTARFIDRPLRLLQNSRSASPY
ncbi:MAG: nucleotidyltransferase family protein [Acidobacteriota bacterium]|nr:nucleotidyltransferase family protein [Acidobacteriota bacterium]